MKKFIRYKNKYPVNFDLVEKFYGEDLEDVYMIIFKLNAKDDAWIFEEKEERDSVLEKLKEDLSYEI